MTNNSWDPTGASSYEGPGGDAPRDAGWSPPSPREATAGATPLGDAPYPAAPLPPPAVGGPAPGRPEEPQPPGGPSPYAEQPGPYQTGGGFQPYYQQAVRDTSGAMTQLIVGIVLTLLCCGTGLPAIICGALALSGTREQAGIDRLVRIGWIITGILVGAFVLLNILQFGFSLALLGGGIMTSGGQ